MIGPSVLAALRLLAPPTLLLAILAAGCDSASSLCGAANETVIIRARVDNNDTNTRIELAFTGAADDSGISRGFCADDTVEVNGQAATKLRRPSGNTVFALNLEEPAEAYAIVITHDGVATELVAEPSAPSLTLTAPTIDNDLSRSASNLIAWEPALGEPEEVRVIVGDVIGGNPCLGELFSADTVDVGSFELAADALVVAAGKFPEKTTCRSFVEVIRLDEVPFEVRSGEAFHPDSRMVAASERSREFNSTP